MTNAELLDHLDTLQKVAEHALSYSPSAKGTTLELISNRLRGIVLTLEHEHLGKASNAND